MNILEKDIKNLKINNIKPLCIYYHPDMLKHKLKDEIEFNRDYPERSLRAKVIYDNLINKKIVEKKDIYTDFEEIDYKYIKETHGEEYINYLLNLKSKNEEFYMEDNTYFNIHTLRASSLSASSILNCTQKIINKMYKNAFAISRPPGHHADIDKKATGFCFLNNIAISANYCINYYNYKKILILDWDVHHGNSTEKLFYNNEKVLYISLHEYNNGNFYPSTGSPDKQGEGNGLGYNINIPVNIFFNENKEKIYFGNKEFIYIFNRIIYPIICDYDPELIFISNGMDCCINDYLGDLNITQDGLCYALSKLKALNKNIIVGLEGGYNLDTIKLVSEGIIRILNGEKMPTKSSNTYYNQEYYDKNLVLNEITQKEINDLVVNYYSKYWPILLNENYINFEKKIKNNSLNYKYHVSGKLELIQYKNDKVFKKSKLKEIKIYNKIYENYINLKKFIPSYLGTSDDNQYLILKNLNYGLPEEVTKINLKFGLPSYKWNSNEKIFWDSFRTTNFYISGMTSKNKNGDITDILINKEISLEKNLYDHKRLFIEQIKSNDIKDKIIKFLYELLITIEKDKIYLLNSSILLLFYKKNNKYKVRLKLISLKNLNIINEFSINTEIKEYNSYIEGIKILLNLLKNLNINN